MKLEEYLEYIRVTAHTMGPGYYIVEVRGKSPYGEDVEIDIELTECHSPQTLELTLRSKLEELFHCSYDYEEDEIDEDNLYHYGGTFK